MKRAQAIAYFKQFHHGDLLLNHDGNRLSISAYAMDFEECLEAIQTLTGVDVEKQSGFHSTPDGIPLTITVRDQKPSTVSLHEGVICKLQRVFKEEGITLKEGHSVEYTSERLYLTEDFLNQLKAKPFSIKVTRDKKTGMTLIQLRDPELKAGANRIAKANYYEDVIGSMLTTLPHNYEPDVNLKFDAANGIMSIHVGQPPARMTGANPVDWIASQMADHGINFPGSAAYLGKSPG